MLFPSFYVFLKFFLCFPFSSCFFSFLYYLVFFCFSLVFSSNNLYTQSRVSFNLAAMLSLFFGSLSLMPDTLRRTAFAIRSYAERRTSERRTPYGRTSNAVRHDCASIGSWCKPQSYAISQSIVIH